ncbi:hypothetical protein CCUS01_03957, partial [Colletotrichum cuscutae]
TKISARSSIYRYLKLTFEIKERGFEIVILYSFYYLSRRKYKILKSKLKYYEYIRRSRSCDVTTSTIYDREFLFYRYFSLY